MKQTKFGVSVGLLGALAYLCSYVSFLASIVFLIFALIWVQESEVKKNSVQAIILSFFYMVLTTILSYLGSGYSALISGTYSLNYSVGEFLAKVNIFPTLNTLLGIAWFVVFLILFFAALKGNVVKIPVVSKLVEKHIPDKAE